jgi:hypothetical protein
MVFANYHPMVRLYTGHLGIRPFPVEPGYLFYGIKSLRGDWSHRPEMSIALWVRFLMRDDPTSLHGTLTADPEGISRCLVVPICNDGYLVEAFCSEVKRSLLPKSEDSGLE